MKRLRTNLAAENITPRDDLVFFLREGYPKSAIARNDANKLEHLIHEVRSDPKFQIETNETILLFDPTGTIELDPNTLIDNLSSEYYKGGSLHLKLQVTIHSKAPILSRRGSWSAEDVLSKVELSLPSHEEILKFSVLKTELINGVEIPMFNMTADLLFWKLGTLNIAFSQRVCVGMIGVNDLTFVGTPRSFKSKLWLFLYF
jgi:hypothetical protein